jgi:hypothetical protein
MENGTKVVSKAFYFWSYLAAQAIAALLTFGLLIEGGGKVSEGFGPLVAGLSVFAVYALVVLALLVYRMWKAIPTALARTTPGKAVGFLFIPVFNLYWWFPAIWGWAKDWNSYAAKSEGKLRQMPENLPLAIAIFGAIGGSIGTIAAFGGVQWLSSILAVPHYILVPIFIFKVCNLLNSAPLLPEEKAVPTTTASKELRPRSFGIASLVLGIVSIILPYLGLICGIVAIVLAKKQRKIFREPLSMAGLITGIIGTTFWTVTTIILIIALSFS